MSEIDWAGAVAQVRRRYFQHVEAVNAGDRSPERIEAIRDDIATLAEAMDHSGPSATGSWPALYDQLEALVRRCGN